MDWTAQFRQFIAAQLVGADGAHDLDHVERVVANARRLAAVENGRLEVIVPAAWLHDCVIVPKNSPDRSIASRLAAAKAAEFLTQIDYPAVEHGPIAHAIEAHSFSAGIRPTTLEAKIVQDADRLDSLGAIGVIRCLLTGASFGTALYHPLDPFGDNPDRPLDDKAYSIDHFYVKLLKLAETMQTNAGREEAAQRTRFLQAFLDQLRREIGPAS